VLRAQDRRIKVLRDNARKAGSFVGSPFSSVHGPQDQEGKALPGSVRHIKIGQANSVAVRIQPARRVLVDIRRAREWAEM
jgi:hypothetical protein